MPDQQIHPILRFIRKVAAAGEVGRLSDGQLLDRFVAQRDEAAFELLLHRHGAMVWRVCRHVLRESHAAEDAFQATFLILVRKAAAIGHPELLGNWLYGVAYRVAQRASKTIARRESHERSGMDITAAAGRDNLMGDEMRPLLQEELQRLPAKYRCALVLCYLEGHTNEEAARQLHWPVGTLKVRLLRGREMLRSRLVRRGLAMSAGAVTSVLSERTASALPRALVTATQRSAFLFAAGKATGTCTVSAQAVALTEGVLRNMFVTKLKIASAVLIAVGALTSMAGLCAYGTLAAERTDLTHALAAEPTVLTRAPAPQEKGKAEAKSTPFAERLDKKSLKERGGNKESEEAVARGLQWLAAQQAADGSWSAGCSNAAAASAFGLLPFLGAGESHKASPQNPHDKVVARGLKFLLTKQDQQTGSFGDGMYAQGLATIALCEAYGLSRDPMLRGPAQKAVDYLVMAQHEAGGWRYAPNQPGDTSVTGWQLQALKAATLAGLDVPKAAPKNAMRFLDSVSNADDGYCYVGGAPSTPTMTASALLGQLNFRDWTPTNKRLVKAVDNHLLGLTPGKVKNSYYFFYASQVLYRLGGKTWQDWNAKNRDQIVGAQVQTKGADFGSWDPAGEIYGQAGGRLMTTSLPLLTLQVYYRYPPK